MQEAHTHQQQRECIESNSYEDTKAGELPESWTASFS